MRNILTRNASWTGPVLGALTVMAICAQAGTGPREAFNEGTERLREGKLRDAEASLQVAVASNHE